MQQPYWYKRFHEKVGELDYTFEQINETHAILTIAYHGEITRKDVWRISK